MKRKRNKKNNKFTEEYLDYLKSPEWRIVRKRILTLKGGRCEACESKKRLNVHHKTYIRLTKELDEDLSLLCETCHLKVHKMNRRKRDLYRTTTDFILSAQPQEPKPDKKIKVYLFPEGKNRVSIKQRDTPKPLSLYEIQRLQSMGMLK